MSIILLLSSSSSDVFATAENAAGTGAASNISEIIKPNAGVTAGTGAAAATSEITKPNTVTALAVGAAGSIIASYGRTAQATSGTGAANAINRVTTTVNAGIASGTGAANNCSNGYIPAGQTTGTGAAVSAIASFGVQAGNAAGTGVASAISSTTQTATPTVAAGTGAANTASCDTGLIVEVGSFAKATSTGNQDITITTNLTSVSSGTWAIMFWTGGSDQASGTWDTDVNATMGFVANEGGSLVQNAAGTYMSGTTMARRAASAIYTLPTSGGSGTSDEATFVSFPSSTSMRINWSTNDGNARTVNYMIFSGLTHAIVSTWSSAAQSDQSSAIGLGFKPDLAIIQNPLLSAGSSSQHVSWGFGVATATGQQWTNSMIQITGGTEARILQQSDSMISMASTGNTVRDEGTFISMDSGGLTSYWPTSNAAGAALPTLFMKGISCKAGVFNKTASVSSQTIKSRHGFAVKGAILSSISNVPFNTGTIYAGIKWSWGASDMTNEKCAAISSQNSASNNDSLYVTGKSLALLSNNTPTTDVTANISASTTDDFTLTYSSSTATAPQICYVLFGKPGAVTSYTFPSAVAKTNFTPYYIGNTFNAHGGGSNSSALTINKPSLTKPGDLLIAYIGVESASFTWTQPSGWTEIYDRQAGNFSWTLSWKVLDGTEGASFDFVSGVNIIKLGTILCYRGAHPTAPIMSTGFVENTSASSTRTCPALTATANNRLINCGWWRDATSSTSSSSGTERLDEDLDGTGYGLISAYDEAVSSVGTTGTRTLTGTGSYTGSGVSILIAPRSYV